MLCTDDKIGPLLAYCGRLSKQYIDRNLRDYDLSPIQGHILHYLKHNLGSAPQKDIEQFLRVKPSTVNGVVCRLEEKGMIVRKNSDSDARCKILELTDEGHRFPEDFHRIANQAEALSLSGFTQDEIDHLHSYLERIINNLNSSEDITND